jgi:AcrR family transcriptional regulator
MTRPRKITDDEILATTRQLLQEHGLGVSTRQIAAACSISEGVLFQRFATKEGLIRAALSLPQIDVPALVADATTSGDARTDLEEIGIVILEVLRRMQLLTALEHHLTEEQAAGRIATDSPHRVAFLVVSTLHNAALFEALLGPLPQVNETTVRHLIGIVWTGLEPR